MFHEESYRTETEAVATSTNDEERCSIGAMEFEFCDKFGNGEVPICLGTFQGVLQIPL